MLQKLLSEKVISFILILFSVFIPFLIVDTYFAFTGWALTFISISTLFILFRPKVTYRVLVLFVITLGLSLSLFFRANPLLTFFNFTGLLYCISFLVYPPQKSGKYSLFNLFILPIHSLISILNTKSNYKLLSHLKIKSTEKPKEEPKTKVKLEWEKIFLGLILTLVVLLIIIPLLASSNPIFSKYISDFGNILNFEWLGQSINWLLRNFFSATVFWRLVWIVFMWHFLPKSVTYIQKTDFKANKEIKERTAHDIVWLIPKITVIAVLALFLVSQIQLYTASGLAIFDIGYTYSSYVNEVFAQMSLVALVVFNLIFFDKFYKGRSLVTSLILIFQGCFLIYVGLKSDLDYISAAGLTFKRLYGLAVIAWLSGIYLGFLYKIFKNKTHDWYLRVVSGFTLSLFLVINIANFDHLIYNVNQTRETKRVAYEYFVELSSDAQTDEVLLINLAKMQDEFLNANSTGFTKDVSGEIESIITQCRYLQSKYSTFQVQSFNLSEYSHYLKIKDIDLSKYDKYINNKRFDFPFSSSDF
jgi:hypothetical protein